MAGWCCGDGADDVCEEYAAADAAAVDCGWTGGWSVT